MTRMESIRRQYENTPLPQQNRPPRGAGRVRPRLGFWRWFWLLFLATLLIGFFSFKSTLLPLLKGKGGKDETVLQAVPSALGTHQGATAEGAKKALDAEQTAYVTPTLAEMNQLFEYVRNAAHVKNNVLYADIMKQVVFGYDEENDTVNAFATVAKLKESDESATPVIAFLGGAARFGRLAALAVAAELSGDKGAGARFVSALRPSDCGKMDQKAVIRILQDAQLAGALADAQVLTKAKSVSAGLMLGIIAHEAGHQALGHCLRRGGTTNPEISRNQEREADSFASSVIASSPFGEYILAGTLFWHYALAHQQQDATAASHPLSKERFENFVRANEKLAASLGITLK